MRPRWMWLIIGTSLAAGCRAGAAEPPADHATASKSRHYVAGELLVKLKPEAGQALDAALSAKRSPTATGLTWLDVLNQRYGVSAIRRLMTPSQTPEDIRRKYPERARRAPPGAHSQSAQYLYALVLRADVDLLRAAAVYSAQPGVEYAQPNYLATAQPTTAPHQ